MPKKKKTFFFYIDLVIEETKLVKNWEKFNNAQCGNLWPVQHFSTISLQNNATDSVKKKGAKFLVHIGMYPVNMHTKNSRSRKISRN